MPAELDAHGAWLPVDVIRSKSQLFVAPRRWSIPPDESL